MADVTLAEANGQTWLVTGDEHVDGLLANTLPSTVTVEIIACETRAEAWAMWEAKSPDAVEGGMPWIINPGVVRRIKGMLGEQGIRFTPWSAMLSEEARQMIATAAGWLAANPGGRLMLRQFCTAAPPPGLTDLQRLRAQLVSAALAGEGAAAAQLVGETATAEAATDCERLDLVTLLAASITEG